MPTSPYRVVYSDLTVQAIMTERSSMVTIEAALPMVESKPGGESFDVIPITRDGRVTGIYHNGTAEPLALRWLISQDTKISALLKLFADTRQVAFLVLHNQDVVGIVTPADLNKLPVRVYLYGLLSRLEMGLEHLIRSRHPSSADQLELLRLLGAEQRQKLQGTYNEQRQAGVDIDLIELLYLTDLIKIVRGRQALWTALGFAAETECRCELDGLIDLRRPVMHSVRPLLSSVNQKDLEKLLQRWEHLNSALQRLDDCLEYQTEPQR